jgi:hypothetical protein
VRGELEKIMANIEQAKKDAVGAATYRGEAYNVNKIILTQKDGEQGFFTDYQVSQFFSDEMTVFRCDGRGNIVRDFT